MVCALTASGLPPGGQRGGEEESADVRIGVYNRIHRSAGTRAVGRWSLLSACVLYAGFAGAFVGLCEHFTARQQMYMSFLHLELGL